eukprot:COSAG01_NODE_14826_length_1405_cov_1.643951_2_plen_218_part_00
MHLLTVPPTHRFPTGFTDDDPAPEPGASQFGPTWHVDFAACVHPGYATVLNCKSTPMGPTPEQRCDTHFADLVAAYDALPEPEQLALAPLKVRVSYRSRELHQKVFTRHLQDASSKAVDVLTKNLTNNFTEEQSHEMLQDLRPDIEHPLVRNVLGRPVLFIGQSDTSFIIDTREANARAVDLETMIAGHDRLAALQAYATQPQFVHSHEWSAGDVVV